jgi:hypothetical protein
MTSGPPRRLKDMVTPKVTEITRAGQAWVRLAAQPAGKVAAG